MLRVCVMCERMFLYVSFVTLVVIAMFSGCYTSFPSNPNRILKIPYPLFRARAQTQDVTQLKRTFEAIF